MGAHLVLRTEGHDKTVISLDKLPLVFGRGREVDLTLASPLVSRRHCEIYQADERICVRDLESLNGTFIGEDRVEDTELSTGDLLTVGAATFEVVLDEAAAEASSGETESEKIAEMDESAFEDADDASGETESGETAADEKDSSESKSDEDPTEDAGEFSFDIKGAGKSKKDKDSSPGEMPTVNVGKGASSKSAAPAKAPAINVGKGVGSKSAAPADAPAINVGKGVGSKSAASADDDDEDLDDFLKHFS